MAAAWRPDHARIITTNTMIDRAADGDDPVADRETPEHGQPHGSMLTFAE